MRVTIHTVQLGFDHCYIVQGEGTIMIDAGAPKKKQEGNEGDVGSKTT